MGKPQYPIRLRGSFRAVRDHEQSAILFSGQVREQGHDLRAGFFI